MASLPDIRAAHDAADNPPVPPLLSDVTGQRRSGRERTATSENIGRGENSENTRAGFTHSEDEVIRESDQLEDDDGKSNSHHRESILTPIRGSVEREDTRMGSPSADGNKSDSSRREGGEPHLLALEEEVAIAANHLRAVQDELRIARGSPRSTNRPDSASQDGSRRGKSTDNNIREAMRILHTPTRKEDETREEYYSRLAASKRIQTEQERDRRAEARRTRKDLEEDTEVEQLQQEKVKHDLDQSNQMDSNAIREREAARYRATRRREHYHNWLESQIILDSIRANDIRVTGKSTVPDREKRPIYPGYPRSEPSDHMDRNATPGPSRPREQDERQQRHEDTRDDRRSQGSGAPQRDTRHTAMGNSPSDPSDGSSSDSTYRPRRSESGTMTTTSSLTPSSNEGDGRERQTRRSQGREGSRDPRGHDRHRHRRRGNARDYNSDPSEPSDLADSRSRRSHRPPHNRRSQSRDDSRSRYRSRSIRTRHETRERSSHPRNSEDDYMDGDGAREEHYEEELLRRYRGLIRDRIGNALEPLPDIKNIRVSPPEKYGGDDDIEVFDTWLAGLLRWFRVYNVSGPQKDSVRVDLTGTSLTGLAATWYADEVEAWNRKIWEWSFENVICGLYKRFIHEVTAQNVANSYKKTKFSRSKGALAYFNDLQRHASRMVQPPDEYSMKRKFLDGLPEDLVENLLKARQVSAEHTSISKLLREVKAMESSLQAFHNYRSERHEKLTTQRVANTSNTASNQNTRTSRIVRFVKRENGSNHTGDSQRKEYKGSTMRPSTKPGYKPSKPSHTNDKGARNTPRPNNSRSGQTGNSYNKTAPKEIECYRCGKKGHYSNECKEQVPRVFAAQVIDEDAEHSPSPQSPTEDNKEAEETAPEDDPEEDLQGSQYESGQEENFDQYEDYVEVQDFDDDESEVVYIRAARAEPVVFSENEITRDITDTESVSDNASTLVDSRSNSRLLVDIPLGITPLELILLLPGDIRMEVFKRRKLEEEPNWVNPHLTITNREIYYLDDRVLPEVQLQLLEMGYISDDEYLDSEWIQRLAVRQPNDFEDLTGYRIPPPMVCRECGSCTPEVQELLFWDDGDAITRTVLRCRNNRNGVSIRAITDIPEPPRAYRSSIRRPSGTMSRPFRTPDEQLCLAAYITINGVKAYALFDSGSTTDAVSPDFTRVATLPVYELDNPVTLQLGCVGSRSKINYASTARVGFGSIDIDTYLDIANLDKYDTILGTPFLSKHGISLDFEHKEIVIHSTKRIRALPEGEGTAAVNPSPRHGRK